MKRQVSIAVPVAESVPVPTFQTILAAVNYAAVNGIEIREIGVTHRQLIDDARNGLTESFLTSDTEWILWLDADMTFPKETITELFKVAEEKNAKMVTGIYYQRRGENLPVLWSRGEETENTGLSGMENQRAKANKYVGAFCFPDPDKKEAFKVHAAGFGCVLVHRSIFEVLDRPWFKFLPGVCSEDFYFFVNAQELGFELWATPNLELGHIGDAPIITKKNFIKKLETNKLQVDAIKQ